jgi:hypothetical protein
MVIVMRVIARQNEALRAATRSPTRVYQIPVRSRIWHHVDVFRRLCVSLESPVKSTEVYVSETP